MNYLIAAHHDWNENNFLKLKKKYKDSSRINLFYIQSKKELTQKLINEIKPRYIFFPHWSYIVPEKVLRDYECVCFHMTDLPYGRGGSPLQNLIIRNHTTTKISALKMTKDLDAGPIYFKRQLKLNGSAQEIYKRASNITFQMIDRMIRKEIEPKEQIGSATNFKRRKEYESKINGINSIHEYYNFIRMLDAPSYPKSFFEYQGFIYEFSNANLKNDKLTANVTIKKIES